jgi:hypothetical protein
LGTPTLFGAKARLTTNIDILNKDNLNMRFGVRIDLCNNNDKILYTTFLDSRNISGSPYRLFSNMEIPFLFALPKNFLITEVKTIKLTFFDSRVEDANKDTMNSEDITWNGITLYLGYDL